MALARGILPPGCAVAATDPRRTYPLLPGEVLRGAVVRRLVEFSAGRHAARVALAGLGLPTAAIPQGADRAPVWPPGISATITHSASACLAAATRGQRGLGLDLEEDRPLDPALWDTVLSAAERDWAEAQPDPGRAALMVFSAKEAAYKAQYPLSRQMLGFDAMEIRFEGAAFAACLRLPVGPFAVDDTIAGAMAQPDGHILTAAWI